MLGNSRTQSAEAVAVATLARSMLSFIANPSHAHVVDAMLLDNLFFGLDRLDPRSSPAKSARAAALEVASHTTDDALVLTASLPGVKQADIAVTLHKRTLTIEATATRASHGRKIKYQRALSLPVDIEAAGTTATHEDGLLVVSVPRAKATRIEISPSEPDTEPSDAHVLTIEAAGVKAADLLVDVTKGGVLTVTGESKSARRTSFVHRKVRLPPDADATAAIATHEDGLLTVVVPKAKTQEEAEHVDVKIGLPAAAAEAEEFEAVEAVEQPGAGEP